MNGLFAVIGDVLEDGIKLHVSSIVADEGRVIVEGKGQARSKAGLEYLDSELVTKVFGRG